MLTPSAARPTSIAVRIVLSRSSQISAVEMPMRIVPNSFSPSLPSSSRSLTSNVPSDEIAWICVHGSSPRSGSSCACGSSTCPSSTGELWTMTTLRGSTSAA